MRYIKSCGFIAYKQIENCNYYLIIESLNGDVGFPKGHMEEGETEIQTAIRELKEETGIEIELFPGFRHQIEYPLFRLPNTIKQSVYFLGKCKSDIITTQKSEVKEASFLSYNDALESLTFDETKEILRKAEKALCQRHI